MSSKSKKEQMTRRNAKIVDQRAQTDIHLTCEPDFFMAHHVDAFRELCEFFMSHRDDYHERANLLHKRGTHAFAWVVTSDAGTIYVAGASRYQAKRHAATVEIQIQHISTVSHSYVSDPRVVIDWNSNEGMRIRLEIACERIQKGWGLGELVVVRSKGGSLSTAQFQDFSSVDPAEVPIDFFDLFTSNLPQLAFGFSFNLINGPHFRKSSNGRAERFLEFIPVIDIELGPNVCEEE